MNHYHVSLISHCLKVMFLMVGKKSHVRPIPKNDNTALPSNYRPISLLSNIDKAFGKCILSMYTITYASTIFSDHTNLASYRGTLQPTN